MAAIAVYNTIFFSYFMIAIHVFRFRMYTFKIFQKSCFSVNPIKWNFKSKTNLLVENIYIVTITNTILNERIPNQHNNLKYSNSIYLPWHLIALVTIIIYLGNCVTLFEKWTSKANPRSKELSSLVLTGLQLYLICHYLNHYEKYSRWQDLKGNPASRQ